MLIAFDFPRHFLALALAASCAMIGCTAIDDRTSAVRSVDAALVHRVEAALVADTRLDADHVSVDARRGVVIVSGLVGDADDLRRVLQDCASVPGVVRVDDQLEIFDFTGDNMGAEGHVH